MKRLSIIGIVILSLLFLLPSLLMADDDGSTIMALLISAVQLVVGLAFYIYYAYCLMTIANKLGVENAWLAWIPIANIYLMVVIAEKPIWWIILFFIPCVNIVAACLVWNEIAVRRGRPNWYGWLMLIPIVNLIIPGYLAFTEA
jgi:hypothetical protein